MCILNPPKLHGRSLIYTAVLFLGALSSASAQQGDDNCGRPGTPDERIAQCTSIIDSRRAKPLAVANALRVRGIAWRMKNDLDRAFADHDRAIQLDPKRAIFYSERGISFRQKGDVDRAIAEHTK